MPPCEYSCATAEARRTFAAAGAQPAPAETAVALAAVASARTDAMAALR
ncbi:MAG TPA: hypothetical protein VID68_02275 [Solirubrobacteraceae bacterium]|jgi:hypothetical protein